MAGTKKKSHKTLCFFPCLGISGDISGKENYREAETGSRKKYRLFSWSSFRMKNSSTKTVPVDAISPEKDNKKGEVRREKKTKSKSKPETNSDNPIVADISGSPRQVISAKVPEETTTDEIQKRKHEPERNAILDDDNRRNPAKWKSTEEETRRRRRSPSRKTESTRTEDGSSPIMPQLKSDRTASIPPQPEKEEASGANSHPIVGMSIILVTLALTLFCGRLFAVLFTSAWIYSLSRFKNNSVSFDVNLRTKRDSPEPDMDSDEYKKKVVLEGLLERNRPMHKLALSLLVC